jgi:hypothetical protein
MRDKFSELIAQGVASFEYTPICGELPEQDPICRFYNNVFGAASDTHMACAADGNRYITGRVVGWERSWENFKYLGEFGGVTFKHSGFWSLSDFLYANDLEANVTILNGDVVAVVTPRVKSEDHYVAPTKAVAMESGINKPLSTLAVDRKETTVKECFKGTIDDVVENLNKNCMVKGTNWIISEGRILGKVDGKIIELK